MTKIQELTLKKYPTWEEFVKKQGPQGLLLIYKEFTSIEKILENRRLQLADIDQVYRTHKEVIPSAEYMNEWLKYLNVFSNINKPLTDTMPVAYMLAVKYSHFTLADLKLIFERIIEGIYGKFYGSVDSQLILNSFLMYDKRRQEILLANKKNQGATDSEMQKERLTNIKNELWPRLKADNPNADPDELFRKLDKLAKEQLENELSNQQQ